MSKSTKPKSVNEVPFLASCYYCNSIDITATERKNSARCKSCGLRYFKDKKLGWSIHLDELKDRQLDVMTHNDFKRLFAMQTVEIYSDKDRLLLFLKTCFDSPDSADLKKNLKDAITEWV